MAYPARKPSTSVSRTLRRKRSGFATSSRNSTLRSFSTIPSLSSATISPPLSLSKMRPFTHGPSISRFVTTTSVRPTTKDLSFSTTAEPTICRPTSSLNHWFVSSLPSSLVSLVSLKLEGACYVISSFVRFVRFPTYSPTYYTSTLIGRQLYISCLFRRGPLP